MSHKEDLLERAASEFEAFHDAIAGLNEEQLTEVWFGTWSVKDIVAHMCGWHREMGPVLERIARGERPLPEGVSHEDVDGWNAKFAGAMRDVDVADALLRLDRSHQEFLRAAAAVPEARFEPGKTAYRIVDQSSAHHYREHAEQIRAWRAARGV